MVLFTNPEGRGRLARGVGEIYLPGPVKKFISLGRCKFYYLCTYYYLKLLLHSLVMVNIRTENSILTA